MRARRSALILSCCLMSGLPAAADAASLIPHRAVYDLALENATERSGISGITGRMVYEFNGSACEGYTVTFRFVTQIDANDTSRLTDQQTTTFEDGAGENFRFITRSFVDQNLEKEVRGTATMTAEATQVEMAMPEDETFTLPPSRFPTQHMIELIDKAEAGETFYSTDIYDGSEDGDKVLTTTVVIGKPEPLEDGDAEADAIEPLDAAQHRPVDIAYFDAGEVSGEETPTYRISFKLYDNGVTRDLVMDYGDFAISGKLVDLALFDAPTDCEPGE